MGYKRGIEWNIGIIKCIHVRLEVKYEDDTKGIYKDRHN